MGVSGRVPCLEGCLMTVCERSWSTEIIQVLQRDCTESTEKAARITENGLYCEAMYLRR
jgi:hypothetical protein